MFFDDKSVDDDGQHHLAPNSITMLLLLIIDWKILSMCVWKSYPKEFISLLNWTENPNQLKLFIHQVLLNYHHHHHRQNSFVTFQIFFDDINIPNVTILILCLFFELSSSSSKTLDLTIWTTKLIYFVVFFALFFSIFLTLKL